MAEKVMAVKTETLPQWVMADTSVQPNSALNINLLQTEWLSRDLAEKNESYRQLIPYLLVESQDSLFAVYHRNGTEQRLHGLCSCGVGGHVNPEDGADTVSQTLKNGANRELNEEFKTFGSCTTSLLGFISETRSSVGRVHLGIVYKIKLSSGRPPEPAEELHNLAWLPPEEIAQCNLELWSRLALTLL